MLRYYFYMQVAFYKVPQFGFTIVIIWYFQSQKYLNHKIKFISTSFFHNFRNFFPTNFLKFTVKLWFKPASKCHNDTATVQTLKQIVSNDSHEEIWCFQTIKMASNDHKCSKTAFRLYHIVYPNYGKILAALKSHF